MHEQGQSPVKSDYFQRQRLAGVAINNVIIDLTTLGAGYSGAQEALIQT